MFVIRSSSTVHQSGRPASLAANRHRRFPKHFDGFLGACIEYLQEVPRFKPSFQHQTVDTVDGIVELPNCSNAIQHLNALESFSPELRQINLKRKIRDQSE